MKRVRLYLLLIALCPIGILQAQTSNSRDFTDYAKESLSDFYSTVMEYILDSSDQYAFLENYKDCFAERGTFVSDIIAPFPKDELNSFNTYLSNIRVKYQSEFTQSDAVPKIVPTNIVVKQVNAQGQGKGIQIQVAYKVTFYKGSDVLFQGDSEAIIAYPNDKNRYAYIVQSVVPKAYRDYRAILLEGNTKLIQLAKVARRKGNYQLAKSLFEQLVERGETDYLFDLARLYTEGYGIPTNKPKALELLNRLYETGTPRGLAGMAYRHSQGLDDALSEDEAYQYALKAAELGDAFGHFFIGDSLLRKPISSHSDTLAAKSHFEYAAANGYAYAYYRLANMYQYSNDGQKVLYYLDKGIAEGDPMSMFSKGLICANGLYGVGKDLEKGEYCLRKVLYDYEVIYASYALGDFYVKKNELNKAIEVFQKAYSAGFEIYAIFLFECYSGLYDKEKKNPQKNDSIMQCRQKALSYLEDGDANDHTGEVAYRAMQIYQGELQTPDYNNAFVYAKKAVDKGWKEANYDLAQMYFDGQGTDIDYNLAKFYYKAYIQRDDFKESVQNGKLRLLVRQKDSRGEMVWKEDSLAAQKYGFVLSRIAWIFQNMRFKNYSKALVYYQKSLLWKHDPIVYYNMGLIYSDVNIKQHYDKEEAIKMFTIAADMGYQKAKDKL